MELSSIKVVETSKIGLEAQLFACEKFQKK